jgi:hypothetical protein
MSWDETKKLVYCTSLPHFSLSSMHEVVGEAILPNTFFQNSSASSRKLFIKLFSKKNNFTSKVELCQISS